MGGGGGKWPQAAPPRGGHPLVWRSKEEEEARQCSTRPSPGAALHSPSEEEKERKPGGSLQRQGRGRQSWEAAVLGGLARLVCLGLGKQVLQCRIGAPSSVQPLLHILIEL